MNDAQRRDMWAGRVERCLAADMTVKEWCGLNKVSESSLYKWMARFRRETRTASRAGRARRRAGSRWRCYTLLDNPMRD